MLSVVNSLAVLPTSSVQRIGKRSWPRGRKSLYAVARTPNDSSNNRLARQGQQQQASPRLVRQPLRISTGFFPQQVGSVFRDIEDELARLWGEDGGNESQAALSGKALGAVDVQETKDGFNFKVDVPGLTKDNVAVRMTADNVLVLTGERTRDEQKDEDGFHMMERSYGKFQRRFSLPDNVDIARVSAEVKDGVLHVTVPKKENEKREATEIPVQDGSAASA